MAPPLIVPIVRPAFDDEESQAVAEVLRSGWLMQGPQVEAFEAALSSYLGAQHVIAVSNGTTALELALRALNIGAGDEVITVSHSFIATANSILALGATPVFVDVEKHNLSLDPERVRSAITAHTKAILCVHQLGFACDLQRLLPLAREAALPVVEDAACALGSEVELSGRWQKLGEPAGALACFSFHPRKVITTGEGGAITTQDAALAQKLRRLRQHAIPGLPAHPDPEQPDGYLHPAFNARMTDIAAAIGLCQLRKLPALLQSRREQAAALHTKLSQHRVLAPATQALSESPNWQSYPARLRPESEFTSARVLQHLKQYGISARGGLTNAHEEPAYTEAARGRWRAGALPVSEHLRRNVIMLPIFPGMTDDERQHMMSALTALQNASP